MESVQDEIHALSHVKDLCETLGINPGDWNIEEKLKAHFYEVPPRLTMAATQLKSAVDEFIHKTQLTKRL